MTDYQQSMLGEYRFREVSGRWACVSGKYDGTPADLCAIFGVYNVPDFTQFLRVNNYEEHIQVVYRDYGAYIQFNVRQL